MASLFEELDRQGTPMGEISLRRRHDPSLNVEIFEAKLGDEFLMSSLFPVAEIALADLGLAAVGATEVDVVVGGLGLGYTAQAALADDRVRSLHVVEALDEVIAWHRRGLVPCAGALTGDARCRLLQGDFFDLVRSGAGFGSTVPDRVHAVLLDIDHSPAWVLHPSHSDFYTPDGLHRFLDLLHPGGVFALWSDAPPDPAFLALLDTEFSHADATVVAFDNPYTGRKSSNTVYVASAAR